MGRAVCFALVVVLLSGGGLFLAMAWVGLSFWHFMAMIVFQNVSELIN